MYILRIGELPGLKIFIDAKKTNIKLKAKNHRDKSGARYDLDDVLYRYEMQCDALRYEKSSKPSKMKQIDRD